MTSSLVWKAVIPDTEYMVKTPDGMVTAEFLTGAAISETEVVIEDHPVNDARSVLLLTARDTVADRVARLDSGADDYLR